MLRLFASKIVYFAIEMGLAEMRKKIATWKLRFFVKEKRKYFIRSQTKGGAIVSAHEDVGMKSKSTEHQRLMTD